MHEMILAQIANYVELTKDEQEQFISYLLERKLRKKQYLVQAGDVCRMESFVVKGCLRAFYEDENGEEHIVQFAIENWWIADLASFLTQQAATLHVEALEDTVLLQISRESLDEIYQKIPKFERYFRILIQNAYVTQQRRLASSMSDSAEVRYQEFIEKYPDIQQRVPQYMIASYLGITPEFLSKIRRNLSQS